MIYKDQFEGRINQNVAVQVDQRTNQILSSINIKEDSVLNRYKYALKGFAAKLSKAQVKLLNLNPQVDKVVPNERFYLSAKIPDVIRPSSTSSFISQTIPWGINRVGGYQDGTGKKAWILDSGIDLDHPDLNVDVANSVSFIAAESADDQVGHGTHVAGILAAKNNSRDVVGVAAGATVVAIKVCNSLPPSDPNHGCPVNSIINGIDYVSIKASPEDIINMSLGGITPITDVDDAVINAANAGLRFTIAAGNEKQNANNVSPARVENANVWTVSAFKQGDNFATSFSCNPNFGSNFSGPTNPPIEFSAPGNNIPSLWKNGGTNTLCGTSMAAPHMAGLLLNLGEAPITDGFVSNDPDSDPDPIASGKLVATTLSGSVVNDHATLNWNTVPQADTYAIYRKQGADQFPAFIKVAEVTGTQYTGRELFQSMQSNGWYSATLEYYVVAQSNGEFRSSGASNFEDFTYYYIPIFPGD